MTERQLADAPISAKRARKALPRRMRKEVSTDEIEQALERLVAAGIADREGNGDYVVRGSGSEARLRILLRRSPHA